MKVSEYIVEVLMRDEIDRVFGYQGGNITHIIDAITQTDNIKYVQTYNEQGAAFAANAYAQVSEKYGVAISSSGPGATNLINGIANAYYDSIPCLFITGNVNTTTRKEKPELRQNGFQECDIVSIVREITKYAQTVLDERNIPKVLEEALSTMKNGRPGPVLIDIPHNIQRAEIDSDVSIQKNTNLNIILQKDISYVLEKLKSSKKPVALLGNGCRSMKAKLLVTELLNKLPIPVVTSLCGRDAINNTHNCYRGMVGSYGFDYSNNTINNADLILVLGSRMDERQRTVSKDEFLANASVIHIDIDKSEHHHVCKHEYAIEVTVEEFLEKLLMSDIQNIDYSNWLEETKCRMVDANNGEKQIFGNIYRDILKKMFGTVTNSTVCVDVGNHQMATAQALFLGENCSFLNSSGFGSMGYALPAAIGAYYANPTRNVVCIVGDGGIMMNLQELQTIKRDKLPISIVLINNSELGMISNYQKIAFGERYVGSRWGYETANFKLLAKAFDIPYSHMNINDIDKVDPVSGCILIELEIR